MFAILFGCKRFHQYVYARKIKTETDHLPLVLIMRKPLCVAPPRLQRMMLQLQRYDLDVHHLPGKDIPVADALSRKPMTDTFPTMSEGMDLHVHTVLSNLPISDRKLEEIRKHSELDSQFKCLSETIVQGWPNSRKQCPESISDFWNYRDQLSVADGLILKGCKILIPESLRSKMLEILHTGHMGIEKCQMRARDTLFWPRISSDISQMVSDCCICQERRNANPKEPLKSHSAPEYPWQVVATDLFTWDNKEFLVITDYYSRYFEVTQISNTRSSTIIHQMKAIFSRHGIPQRVVSDNAPYYTSQEFKEFIQGWDIDHTTSSPHYPQSNGLAEKSVQTIKKIFSKAKADKKDPYIGLLEYRATPLDIGYSPSELLFGRQLRSVLPVTRERLVPKLPSPTLVRKKIVEHKGKSKMYYDRSAKALTPLSEGDSVRVQMQNKLWKPATVISKHNDRSFSVCTNDNAVYRRNRRQLLVAREPVCVEKQNKNLMSQSNLNEPASTSLPQEFERSKTLSGCDNSLRRSANVQTSSRGRIIKQRTMYQV